MRIGHGGTDDIYQSRLVVLEEKADGNEQWEVAASRLVGEQAKPRIVACGCWGHCVVLSLTLQCTEFDGYRRSLLQSYQTADRTIPATICISTELKSLLESFPPAEPPLEPQLPRPVQIEWQRHLNLPETIISNCLAI